MLRNLKAEMVRANVSVFDLANLLSVTRKTIDNKIAGRSEFSITDAIEIRNALFPEVQLEYLFTHTN